MLGNFFGRKSRRVAVATALAGVMVFTLSAAVHGAAQCFDAEGRWVPGVAVAKSGGQCFDISIPAHAGVQWMYKSNKPLSAATRLQASGIHRAAPFQPNQVTDDMQGPLVRNALPFGQPLLAQLLAMPFGIEERVRLSHNTTDKVTVVCRAGEQPAGVLLRAPEGRMPAGADGVLQLSVLGDEGFSVGLSRGGQAPRQTQSIKGAKASSTVQIALTDADVAFAPDALVIVCPPHAGQLTLTNVKLVAAPTGVSHPKAGWAWAAHLWRDGEGITLLREAAEYDIRTLYISVSISAGGRVETPDALARFVARATEAGVAVWVVEGDPAMALDTERQHALNRLQAILAYQSSAPVPSRLAGVQYDIEPYLLPAYVEQPLVVAQQWRDTLSALSRAAGNMPMDTVVPFWLLSSPAGENVLAGLRTPMRSLTVMAYRTDIAAIQSAAEPLLAWGARHQMPVRVALEAGPLQDEAAQYFMINTDAAESELWTIPIGDGEVVVRFDEAVRLDRGQGYRWIRDSTTAASHVSFLGDWPRLRATVDVLEGVFPAWQSYAGISLHGLLE